MEFADSNAKDIDKGQGLPTQIYSLSDLTSPGNLHQRKKHHVVLKAKGSNGVAAQ